MICGTDLARSLIIIVEPNEKVRGVLYKFIERMGYHGVGLHPSQFEHWIACGQANQVQAQIIDIGISPDPVEMSLAHLTRLWNGNIPPTVFISTNPVIVHCLSKQGYRALLKPFSLSTLRDILVSYNAASLQMVSSFPDESISSIQEEGQQEKTALISL